MRSRALLFAPQNQRGCLQGTLGHLRTDRLVLVEVIRPAIDITIPRRMVIAKGVIASFFVLGY
jgi:hypothetical protein